MLSAGRALVIAARTQRASGGRSGTTTQRPTTMQSRRASSAVGRAMPQRASPRFLTTGAGTAAVAAALRPLGLQSAAIVAAAAVGLYVKRNDAQGLVKETDLTAPPPPQQLALSSAAEQERAGAGRRVADALLRWIEAVYRQARILLRLAEITLVASPCLATYPIAARLQHRYPELYEAWWSWFLASVEYLGPACIKFMQWASSRRDLFDARVCDRLTSVQAAVGPHPERDTDRALRAAFGPDWDQAVLALEDGRAVLGSGCIAQVYRGRLAGSGREVAVKVVHPGVRGKVEADLALFGSLAALLERVVPSAQYWSIGDALREFDGLMRMQLDMSVEAANLRRLRANFEGHPQVAFPEPLLAHPDVLVEEFIHGEPISSFIHMEDKDAPIRRQLAETSLHAFLLMLVSHNYTHADLHAGNLLVQPNSQSQGRPIVTFLDAGIVTELNAASRRAFVQIFWHVCRGDGESVARTVLQTAPKEACADPEAFVEALADIVNRFNEGSYDTKRKAPLLAHSPAPSKATPQPGELAAEARPAAAVGDVFELCRAHRVKLDGALSTVVIATFLVEGLARSLDPDVQLFRAAFPLLASAVMRPAAA